MATAEVDAWFAEYQHPLIETMQLARKIMLESSSELEECVKWKSPTFTYKGNLASFNPRTKKHVSLMFHTGAKISGDFPSLEGSGETARYMKFHSVEEVEACRNELGRIVRAWVTLQDGA